MRVGLVLLIGLLAVAFVNDATAAADAERGRYVFGVAGCESCHTPKTDKKLGIIAAGGRALKTPFGTFYSPNITADTKTGIGTWSLDDFRRALTQGRSPDGVPYFPAFPFTSYAAMTKTDVADLWAYVQTLPAVSKENRAHDVSPPMGWRLSAWVWQLLFFSADAAPPQDRGAYLVNVLGHCGECHTPRNRLGALDSSRHLAGTDAGPHGGIIPNITPDEKTGLGKWSDSDFKALFTLGMLPNADFVGGSMAAVVDHGTSIWTEADRIAATRYLKSIPAVHNPLKTKTKKSTSDDEWN